MYNTNTPHFLHMCPNSIVGLSDFEGMDLRQENHPKRTGFREPSPRTDGRIE